MAGKYAANELQASLANSLVAAFLESDLDPQYAAALFGENPRGACKDSLTQAGNIRELKGAAAIPLPAGARLSSFTPGSPNQAFEAFVLARLREAWRDLHSRRAGSERTSCTPSSCVWRPRADSRPRNPSPRHRRKRRDDERRQERGRICQCAGVRMGPSHEIPYIVACVLKKPLLIHLQKLDGIIAGLSDHLLSVQTQTVLVGGVASEDGARLLASELCSTRRGDASERGYSRQRWRFGAVRPESSANQV